MSKPLGPRDPVANPTADPWGPMAWTSINRIAAVHSKKRDSMHSAMQKHLRLSFFICSTFLLCIWLLPEAIIKEGRNIRKKPRVTRLIRFVSLPIDQHQHFDCQEYEQKGRRIGLRAYDKNQRTDGVHCKRQLTFVLYPNFYRAVLQRER